MDERKVSVILPVYNAAGTVEKCLESILAQTWTNLEVLAVDDGSKDQSLSLLEAFEKRDSRVRVIRKANGGVSSARNIAINQATGAYLQFVDSDDTLPPDATRRMAEAMEKPECDLVLATYTEVVGPKQTVRGYLREDMELDQRDFLDCFSSYPNSFYYAVLWNKLYRREIVIMNGIRCDLQLPWGEDFAFNTQYFRYIRRAAILKSPVYSYYRNIRGLALTTARQCALHPVKAVRVKLSLQEYLNQLFKDVGIYHKYRLALKRYLYRVTINQ